MKQNEGLTGPRGGEGGEGVVVWPTGRREWLLFEKKAVEIARVRWYCTPTPPSFPSDEIEIWLCFAWVNIFRLDAEGEGEG